MCCQSGTGRCSSTITVVPPRTWASQSPNSSALLTVADSATSRTDSGGKGVTHKIDAGLYNNALNDAWLAGEIDPMVNFPADPADETVLATMRRRLTEEQVGAWRLWREDYKRMYLSLGVHL